MAIVMASPEATNANIKPSTNAPANAHIRSELRNLAKYAIHPIAHTRAPPLTPASESNSEQVFVEPPSPEQVAGEIHSVVRATMTVVMPTIELTRNRIEMRIVPTHAVSVRLA